MSGLISTGVKSVPCANDGIATLKSKRVDDGLTEVLGINHLLITGLAIVHCGEFGGIRNYIRAGIRRVFGSVDEFGAGSVVTGSRALRHHKLEGVRVDSDTNAGDAGFTRISILGIVTGQIDKDVTHGTVGRLSEDSTGPTEPTACTVIAVAVVGTLSHLETEVLVGGSVIQAQQAVVEASCSFEIAETTIHVIDVPVNNGRINGCTTSVVLQSTTVGDVFIIRGLTFINNEYVPLLGRVRNPFDSTGQDGLTRFKTLQLQPRARRHEILGSHSGNAVQIVQHQRTGIRSTDRHCCGCSAQLAVFGKFCNQRAFSSSD